MTEENHVCEDTTTRALVSALATNQANLARLVRKLASANDEGAQIAQGLIGLIADLAQRVEKLEDDQPTRPAPDASWIEMEGVARELPFGSVRDQVMALITEEPKPDPWGIWPLVIVLAVAAALIGGLVAVLR